MGRIRSPLAREPHDSKPVRQAIFTSMLKAVRDWARFALITLLLFVLVRGFLLEAFTIPTSSMEGTLLVGDFLFVNKALYGAEIPGTAARLPAFREPQHGDIVVFSPPHDPGRTYVKRVVGVAGDTLEMKKKTLIRNGQALDEAYALHRDAHGDAVHPGMRWQAEHLLAQRPRWRYSPSRDTWGPLVVPPGRLFVLGDNRDNSEDSRYWGFIDRNDVRGRPWVVYLSLSGDSSDSSGWLRRIRWDRVGYFIH